MPDFKVIKNPDGTFTTAPADAAPDVQKARQGLRDMLNGGGWFQDPNAAPKVDPEAQGVGKWVPIGLGHEEWHAEPPKAPTKPAGPVPWIVWVKDE